MLDFLIVFMTASSRDEAERIARALVDSGAAACVNIVPSIVSIYAWRRETHREEESLMIAKSARELFPKVREIVERLHSYEVPEVVAVPLACVSERYGAYLEAFFGETG
jgi:periplasmic divalent cation tolerance protein